MQVDVPPGLVQAVYSQLVAQQQVSDAFERIFGELQRAGQASRDLQVRVICVSLARPMRCCKQTDAWCEGRCATASWTRRRASCARRALPCRTATTSSSTALPASSRCARSTPSAQTLQAEPCRSLQLDAVEAKARAAGEELTRVLREKDQRTTEFMDASRQLEIVRSNNERQTRELEATRCVGAQNTASPLREQLRCVWRHAGRRTESSSSASRACWTRLRRAVKRMTWPPRSYRC